MSSFSWQVGSVARVVARWGAAERAAAAVLLARRLPAPGRALLRQELGPDPALAPGDRTDDDEALLAELLAADGDHDDGSRLAMLLALVRGEHDLPLDPAGPGAPTVPGGPGAPAVPETSTDPVCRQLLSCLLSAPSNAGPPHDQRTLAEWLRYIESQASSSRSTETVWQQEPGAAPGTAGANIWGGGGGFRRTVGRNVEFRPVSGDELAPDPLQESFSKNGRDVELSAEEERTHFDACVAQPKSQRSNSLTTHSTVHEHDQPVEPLEPTMQKPRSFSLSLERVSCRGRLERAAARSEPRLGPVPGPGSVSGTVPGTGPVPGTALWLKSLRLHKYAWLFNNITYDQMLALDDEYLEKLGVTQGARHKILVSISRLATRRAELQRACADLRDPARLVPALHRLRTVLDTPMRAGGALPGLLLAALAQAADVVTSLPPSPAGTEPGADPLALHCWLIERALQHESFATGPARAQLLALRHRLPPHLFYRHAHAHAHAQTHAHAHAHPHASTHPHHRHKWRAPPPRPKSHSYPPFPPAHPSRSHPHPHTHNPHSHSHSHSRAERDEYCDSLDRLCLQMTEQAIN